MPPHLLRLLFDAEACFPYAVSLSGLPHSIPSWALTPSPARALAALSPAEREKILRFHFPRDAALALGSALLKRVAVVRGLDVSWEEAGRGMRREQGGKPYWQRPTRAVEEEADGNGEEVSERVGTGGEQVREIEFNVSHHGSLVVLIASVASSVPRHPQASAPDASNLQSLPSYPHRVGIDVTRIDIGRSIPAVHREGSFASWVNIYGDVFHPSELQTLTSLPDSLPLETRLRRFYTSWALREAYVKMTGEALLATWLRELEFKEVSAPEKGVAGGWGEGWTGVEVWVRGERVSKVEVEVRGQGEDYIVASVVEGWERDGGDWVAFEEVDFEREIRPLMGS